MTFRKKAAALSVAAVMFLSFFTDWGAVFAATYTAMPDHIVCTPHGDLKTQVGLAWTTDKSGTVSKAQVMVKKSEPLWEEAVTYTGEAGDIDNWRWHKVTVTGLTPDTEYIYRVGDGNNWSETCEFKTAPQTGDTKPFTFIQVNDTQASNLNGFLAGQSALEKATERFPDFKFVVHGGDTVSSGGNEDEWQMYFDTTKNVLRKTVYAGVMGNHENENYNGVTTTPRYPYRFNYQVPEYATRDSGMYYSFDYGNAHFTVMHGKAFRDEKQVDWLKYDLAKNSKKWNIVLIHQPLYSNGSHSTEANIISARNTFAPVLNDMFGVDMVFTAHEHIYSRTYPIWNNQPITGSPVLTNQTVNGISGVSLWDNPTGTVHQLNNACGLKYYNVNEKAERKWFVQVNGDIGYQPAKPTYAGVTVTENEIVNSAYYVDGNGETLIENQGIRKTTPQINPPRNVKREYADGKLTIIWDEPEYQAEQSVSQYVLYDNNNAFTKENATYFTDGDKRSISISMTEDIYKNTDFVVKAIGQHYVSDEGIMDIMSDPDNPKTSLWIKSVCDSKNNAYTDINEGISEGSYVTVVNNKESQVQALCVVGLYDKYDRLVRLYNLEKTEIESVSEMKIALPEIDTRFADKVKILGYINSADPAKPGGMPFVIDRIN